MNAVLLMAYGSPNSLEEVEEYLTDIRHGKRPDRADLEELKERYSRIGGSSPLLQITRLQATALETALRHRDIPCQVYVGMKHWHPFIRDVLKDVLGNSHNRLIGVALTPFYSKMTVGEYSEAIKRGLDGTRKPISWEMVKSFHDHPLFLEAWTNRIRSSLIDSTHTQNDDTYTIFTAHSLPEEISKSSDPYPSQLNKTAQKIANLVQLRKWSVAYQSAGMRGGSWLGPDVEETISSLARNGQKNILIAPIGFLSDNLETLYDIDVRCRELATSLGVNIRRPELLNDNSTFIEAIASKVSDLLSR